MLARDADRVVEIGQREVGRDLDQKRHRPGAPAHPLARVEHAGEQIVERLGLLQIAQAGRVGRGDVDGEIAGDGGEGLDQLGIIAAAVGAVAVGADIDADDAALPGPRGEPLERRGGARIVEAEAVDHALVRFEPEQARPRITGLRQRGERTDLDKAETEPQQRVRHLGVLVETGGEPNRIGEIQPEGADGQFARVGRRPRQRHIAQGLDRQGMCVLGVEGPHQRAGQPVEETDHRLRLRGGMGLDPIGPDAASSRQGRKESVAGGGRLKAIIPIYWTSILDGLATHVADT